MPLTATDDHDVAPDDLAPGTADDIVILIPAFNDWSSLVPLVGMIDERVEGVPARVLVVDDGSTEPPPARAALPPLRNLRRVDVVELRCNLGHQRAIAVGLAFVEAHLRCRAVLVMDADGEDSPDDIPRLLRELDDCEDGAVVFAERIKRSESLVFRLGYGAYRVMHRLLTGIPVKFGNFSVMPRRHLRRVVVVSEMWNHYAAAVVRSRTPIRLLPTARAARISGTSSMNTVALVGHGLSAMAVFGDRVAVRLLATSALLSVAVLAGFLALASVQRHAIVTELAGHMYVAVISSAANLLVILIVFSFLVLGGRDRQGFLPLRDHGVYVGRIWPWASR